MKPKSNFSRFAWRVSQNTHREGIQRVHLHAVSVRCVGAHLARLQSAVHPQVNRLPPRRRSHLLLCLPMLKLSHRRIPTPITYTQDSTHLLFGLPLIHAALPIAAAAPQQRVGALVPCGPLDGARRRVHRLLGRLWMYSRTQVRSGGDVRTLYGRRAFPGAVVISWPRVGDAIALQTQVSKQTTHDTFT